MELLMNKSYLLGNLRIALFLAGYMVFGATAFSDYFIVDSNLLVALCLAPFILTIDRKNYSFRYLIPAVLFVGTSFFTGVRSILFLGFIFSMLFTIETTHGKTSWSVMWMLFFVSPVFKFLALTFGFPIRLFLSKVSAYLLSFFGSQAVAIGNIIQMNGREFSVDPECMGLSMLTVSLLLALFMEARVGRKKGRTLSIFGYSILLGSTFLLNVICNLMRIMLVVRFGILPGTTMHDVIGIICLITYVLIPLYFLVKKLKRKSNSDSNSSPSKYWKGITPLNISLLSAMTLSFAVVDKSIPALTPDSNCLVEGFSRKRLDTGVIQFSNQDALVYVKPLHFYNAEHSPLVCWSGSGFGFKNYQAEMIGGTEVYCGIIERGKERIHSAWWFDNGRKKTISQFEWRVDAIVSGDKYCLVNVNAATKEELIEQTAGLLRINIFQSQQEH